MWNYSKAPRSTFALALILTVPIGCGAEPDASDTSDASEATPELTPDQQLAEALTPTDFDSLDAPLLLTTLTGFEGPESVYYDPDQDVWFVSSFTGNPGERDGNGTVARVAGDDLTDIRYTWASASNEHPFHAGRGMTVQGDTLWVADLDGVHGFDRESGDQLVFVDLSHLEPGFLNDVAASDDGTVWVTDTGGNRLIQVRPEAGVEVALGDRVGAPNGILWDGSAQGFWLAPWTQPDTVFMWHPLGDGFSVAGVVPNATNMDGLVGWFGWVLVGVQSDSAIHVLGPDGFHRRWIELPGRPADIGADRSRDLLAVPYVSLNEVQIWQLHPPTPRAVDLRQDDF